MAFLTTQFSGDPLHANLVPEPPIEAPTAANIAYGPIVVALITLISTGVFLSHHWWLPHAISTIAPALDRQFTVTFIITGIIFVVAQLALAYAVWKFRDQGDARRAAYSHGNTKWELTWTIAAAILFIGLNLMGYQIWANVHFTGAEAGAMPVEVWGEQFNWYSATRARTASSALRIRKR